MQFGRNFHHAHVGNHCFRLETLLVSALQRILLFPSLGLITFCFQSWAQAVFKMACSKLGVATRAFVAVLLSLARAYQLALDVNRDSSRELLLKAYKKLLLKVHPCPCPMDCFPFLACLTHCVHACSHLFARSLFAAIWLWSPQQPSSCEEGLLGGPLFWFPPALPGGREEFPIFASLDTGSRY